MNQDNRMPFSIEAYNELVVEKKTHRVVTRGAYIATVLRTDFKSADGPILVTYEYEGVEYAIKVAANGLYYENRDEDPRDLLLEKLPAKSLGWINFFRSDLGLVAFHPDRESADAAAKDPINDPINDPRIACVEIFENQGL
jgi:hypothetical protein